MTKSTYDLCLLFINQSVFERIRMQTDDTLMLRDDRFAELEENELKKAKLTFKKRKMLIIVISIKFNDEMISLIETASKNSYSLSLTQFKQFNQIQLINLSTSTDLQTDRRIEFRTCRTIRPDSNLGSNNIFCSTNRIEFDLLFDVRIRLV